MLSVWLQEMRRGEKTTLFLLGDVTKRDETKRTSRNSSRPILTTMFRFNKSGKERERERIYKRRYKQRHERNASCLRKGESGSSSGKTKALSIFPSFSLEHHILSLQFFCLVQITLLLMRLNLSLSLSISFIQLFLIFISEHQHCVAAYRTKFGFIDFVELVLRCISTSNS